MSVTAVPLQPTPRRILVMLWVGILAAIAIAVGLAFAAPSNPVSGFLATNAHEDGVVQPASGLQYKVLEPGKGAAPTDEDVALANCDGQPVDGPPFGQSQKPVPVPQGRQWGLPGSQAAPKNTAEE